MSAARMSRGTSGGTVAQPAVSAADAATRPSAGAGSGLPVVARHGSRVVRPRFPLLGISQTFAPGERSGLNSRWNCLCEKCANVSTKNVFVGVHVGCRVSTCTSVAAMICCNVFTRYQSVT